VNIRTLCLGILFFEEATGYEINKLASEGRFSHFIEASYGSIYPALTKLMDDGYVTVREERQVGKPARKVYAITEKGRKALLDGLYDEPGADIFKSEFLFVCLYSEFLEPNYLSEMLDRRVEVLEEKFQMLHELSERCDHPASQFAIGYGKALNRAAIEFIKENREKLEARHERKTVQAAH